jgi:tRNA U34 2-thiouridine synthase MnmA/TrmU
MRHTEAIALVSGGLDSTLAARLVQEQGIEIHAIHFVMPFCSSRTLQAEVSELARGFGWELELVALGEAFVEVVRNPQYGYGKHLNPCVDCRVFTLSRARERMHKHQAEFVLTGEVLGQRPMSQRRDAMRRVEKESGLEGRLLRPLSAKCLEPTIPELEGVVDRDRLLDISGRSRRPQMALAQKLGVTQYPTPAGGCLLTDAGFARRLTDLFAHDEATLMAIEHLKVGRHFRLREGQKVVAGRNEQENLRLEQMANGDVLKCSTAEVGSALVMLFGERTENAVRIAAQICARYSAHRDRDRVSVGVWKESEEQGTVLSVAPMSDEELAEIRI